MTKADDLAPWTRGPFELIRHANEHLQVGKDADRRIALVGFDNAVELCIDVFIRLHPRLREGYQITKDDANKASRNYHTKIEFLDTYMEQQSSEERIPVDHVIWYHILRNEIYHSGNGMVPETHVLEGQRDAAILVFKALFGKDVTELLELKGRSPSKGVPKVPRTNANAEMDFMGTYIDLEQALSESLHHLHPQAPTHPRNVTALWREYRKVVEVPAAWDSLIQRATNIRNGIAHNRPVDIDGDRLVDIAIGIMELTEKIRGSRSQAVR